MSSPADVLTLIRNKIRELERDPESLVRAAAHKEFVFVPTKGFNPRQGNGVWTRKGSKTIASHRLLGQLGESLLNPYFDLQGAPSGSGTPGRVSKVKGKFALQVPGDLDLSKREADLLREQMINLNEMQLVRELDPTYPKMGDGPGEAEVKALVRKLPGNAAEMTLATTTMWKSNRKGGPSKDLFADEDENVQPTEQAETLESWPDPKNMYFGVNKSEFVLNTDHELFDVGGARVHPRDFRRVFGKGTWVQADVILRLWIIHKKDADGKEEKQLSRVYSLEIVQMQALTDPTEGGNVDEAVVGKWERSTSPAVELSPPKKRPFGSISAHGSSTSLDPLIDWSPSPPFAGHVDLPIGEESAGPQTPKRASRITKAAKGKGKGRADEGMEED